MKTKKTCLIFLFLFSITKLYAQTDSPNTAKIVTTDSVTTNSGSMAAIQQIVHKKPSMNIVKINLFGIVLNNYQLQYERVLTRKISVAVAFRTMPVGGVPFKNALIKAINDQQTADKLNSFKVGNSAITPEVRFYLSKKGYGRGFYLAPYFRHTVFTTKQVSFNYDTDNGEQATVQMSGKLIGNSGGLLIGVQRAIGKHVILDSWILGPEYGSSTGNLTGIFSQPLSTAEQQSLRNSLEDIGISQITSKATVTANNAAVHLTGPWAGVRIGLNLGIRF